MSNPAIASIWLDVPDDCPIRAEFTGDRDIQITLGDWHIGHTLLFERDALERFVKLAGEVLAVPLPADRRADLPMLESAVA